MKWQAEIEKIEAEMATVEGATAMMECNRSEGTEESKGEEEESVKDEKFYPDGERDLNIDEAIANEQIGAAADENAEIDPSLYV